MKTLHLSIIATAGIAIIGIILFAVVLPQLANIKPSESVQQAGTYEYVIHEPYDGVEKNFGTVTIMNQTYYVANLNNGIINSTQPTWLEYYNVTFTFPHGIEPLNTPGGQIIESYVKFPDDPVPYRMAAGISPPPGSSNYTGFTTVLSTHTNPQAGFTFHNGTIQLLINWPKIHSEINVVGLNDTYKPGQPVDFQIQVKGFNNFDAGAIPDVNITKSDGAVIWKNPTSIVLCCPMELTDYDRTFNFTELGGPVILNEAGLYSVVIHYPFQTVVRNFAVIQSQIGEKSYHVYFPGQPPPIIDTRIAKIVSGTQEAQSIVGYYVGMPHYLPPGYSMQVILADGSSKSVKILASNFPLTQNTTSVEFMDKGGIMIYMEPITSAFNQTSWTAGWIKQTPGSSETKINGYDGVINDITKGKRYDEEIDIPAEIIVFQDNVMVEIRGFLHPDELTKIAEGMLAK